MAKCKICGTELETGVKLFFSQAENGMCGFCARKLNAVDTIDVGGKYAVYLVKFEAKKTVYSDDENRIEGYDGETTQEILLFNTKEEADDFHEIISERICEEEGSTFKITPLNFKW
jgi:hypothetical protein